MGEDAPLVSVVIPTYNSGRYIGKSLDSVLGQTYRNFEIIVVDDGSTDDTVERLRTYEDRITYVYQKNKGPSSSRNRGIRTSNGQYVAFLDSDDIWSPMKLKRQVEFMERNTQLGFSFTDAAYFDEHGELVTSFFRERKVFHRIPVSTTSKSDKVFAHKVWKELFFENFIVTSTVMIRRGCFDAVGLFDEGLSNAEDFDLWFRLARKYRGGAINETLTLKRYHEANISTIDDRVLDNWLRARKKIVHNFPEVSQTLRGDVSRIMKNGHFQLGYWFFVHRQTENARRHFLEGLKYKFDLRTLCFFISTYAGCSLIDFARRIKRVFTHEQAA